MAKTLAKNAPKFSGAPVYAQNGKPRRDNLPLQTVPGSNVPRNKHDVQIAVYKNQDALRETGKAGVFDYFKQVYRLADEAEYVTERAGKGSSYKDWRTYRMSAHLPMWIEFDVDDADAYLAKTLAGAPP